MENFFGILKQEIYYYSFLLWYVLNHHFAKEEDVEKMGLTKGRTMVLGRFQEHILGINRAASVLCFGEIGRAHV